MIMIQLFIVIDVELSFMKVNHLFIYLFIFLELFLGCYNADALDDKSSDSSSPSEYWFCTPCLARVNNPVRNISFVVVFFLIEDIE